MVEVITPNNDTVTISRAEYDELKRADMRLYILRNAIDENTDFSQYYDHKMNLKNDDRFYFTLKIVDSELYYAIKARLEKEQAEKEKPSSIKEEEVE
jgi:hypothetical protein